MHDRKNGSGDERKNTDDPATQSFVVNGTYCRIKGMSKNSIFPKSRMFLFHYQEVNPKRVPKIKNRPTALYHKICNA